MIDIYTYIYKYTSFKSQLSSAALRARPLQIVYRGRGRKRLRHGALQHFGAVTQIMGKKMEKATRFYKIITNIPM